MNKVLKKGLVSLLAMVMCVFQLVIPTSAASIVKVNLASKQQKISGYGASSAWNGALSDYIMNSLYNNCGFSIIRLRIAENEGWKTGNFNAWASELSNAKKATARGAIVFASPWNPPASMCEKIYKNGKQCNRLRYDKYNEYVQYLNSFAQYMKDNGVNLYAISIQNEPDYGYGWTWWEPNEIFNFTKNYAGKINCPVMSAETFAYNKNYYNNILNDSQAFNNVAVFGTHFYGTQEKDMPYALMKEKGKEIWMTEHYFDDPNIKGAMETAKDIHLTMVDGNMNAYVYWWIDAGNGLINTSSKAPLLKSYVIGQYSNFIHKGYYRVSADARPQSNVYVSAYTGDGKAVIVAINQGTSAVNQTFNISNGAVSKVSTWTTSNSQKMAKGSDITVNNGSFTASLPAQSVTTFVGNAGAGSDNEDKDDDEKTPITNYATLKDGWYYIKNTGSQKYLQVKDNKGADAQNVEIGAGTGVAGQKWQLVNVGEGYVTLKNGNGYMLDVAYGKDEDCTNIQTYSANGMAAQQFKLLPTAKEGTYGIVLKCATDVRGLDVFEKSTADGANVQEYFYYGADNQTWGFESCQAPGETEKPGEQDKPGETEKPGENDKPGETDKPVTGDMVNVKVVSDWTDGATADVTITNTTGKALNGWTCTFTTNRPITSLWNATLVSQSGNTYTISNPDWQPSLAAGGSYTFGCSLGSGPATVAVTNASLK